MKFTKEAFIFLNHLAKLAEKTPIYWIQMSCEDFWKKLQEENTLSKRSI